MPYPTTAEQKHIDALRATWREAYRTLSDAAPHNIDQAQVAEQDAYDALVDYVDANDLHVSPTLFDPR